MSNEQGKFRLKLLLPDWDVPAHVLACTTLRQSIDPANPYEGFNLASHVGDKPERVTQNRELLKLALALPAEPHWLDQVHSDRMLDVDELQKNAVLRSNTLQADATFTRTARQVLVIMTADCLPVLVTDCKGRGIAAIHAGWRGLARGILRKSLNAFITALDIKASECRVWLGPAISQKYFEVGKEVLDTCAKQIPVAPEAFSQKTNNKYACDIYHLARLELQSLGIDAISGGDQCTYAQESEYYSHRRHTHQADIQQDPHCGRMASLIWLSDLI
ncbi:MAG: peptidoglycan editing factor PgeF [Gammaproteobacteria bacterium]|nr:peptidoglycan editing factor PgeF [Gammaproteobacteria bacterium]